MTLYRFDPDNQHLIPYRSASWGESYTEQDLEDWLESNPAVVAEGEPLLIIARQPSTPFSGTPDLIALDADGNTVVIELKRGRTPRDVVAQALEYAAWLDGLDQEDIIALADSYLAAHQPGRTLDRAWRDAFGTETQDEPDAPPTLPAGLHLNRHQRLILVLEGADERTTHVVRYLRKLGLDVNLVEYRFYRVESGEEVLDVRVRVGRETQAGSGPAHAPTEEALIAGWPPDAQAAYRAFRQALLAADDAIMPEPRAASISFYKHTRDGRVFIGTYASYKERAGYWFRRDSLQDRLDLEALVKALKARQPAGINFRDQGLNDCSFAIPFSPSHSRQVARLIAEEIAGRLE